MPYARAKAAAAYPMLWQQVWGQHRAYSGSRSSLGSDGADDQGAGVAAVVTSEKTRMQQGLYQLPLVLLTPFCMSTGAQGPQILQQATLLPTCTFDTPKSA